MMYGGSHMGAGSWIPMFGTVIVLALIVTVIVWLLSNRSGRRQASAASPSEILDRRLANGEITSAQYDESREQLSAAPREQRPPSPVGAPD
jgi:uncharacterized membrane protein